VDRLSKSISVSFTERKKVGEKEKKTPRGAAF